MKETLFSHFPLRCIVPSHHSPFLPSQLFPYKGIINTQPSLPPIPSLTANPDFVTIMPTHPPSSRALMNHLLLNGMETFQFISLNLISQVPA